MKKLFALIALVSFVFASCDKEETAQPDNSTVSSVNEKKDLSGWD